MKLRILLASLLALLLAIGIWVFASKHTGKDSAGDQSLVEDARAMLAAHRKLIVLFATEQTLKPAERAAANQVGQAIFHENRQRVEALEERLAKVIATEEAGRFAKLEPMLDFMESGAGLFDADRLAFRDVLRSLRESLAKDGAIPAIKLHKRIGEDLDALAEVEKTYEKEIRQVFGRFEQRAIELKRERWEDYLAKLQQLYKWDAIIKEYGVVVPYDTPIAEPAAPAPATPSVASGAEVFGTELPPKTLVLSFDDGPHATYTKEIQAILNQYGLPAIFFQVGSNLGKLDDKGAAKLAPRADVSRQLRRAGHVLANHSLTHAQLSKKSGEALKAEVMDADALLRAAVPDRSNLFRFPYGARNKEALALLAQSQLRSMMWNIDSLDWADPVPASIAERVMRSVNKEGRGIILFHDIHERTVKALPGILDRLIADGYRFATWDGKGFSTAKEQKSATRDTVNLANATAYAESWAIIIGIDDYAKWSRLQYAVKDARAVRDVLIRKFGFNQERVLSLENGAATRSAILSAFHDRLAHGGMKANDRLFVFFAGHGATKQLSSGRELGYIVPVDADPNQIATDAIPMTELQNIAESVTAKHTLFVMDACYSGLGLTRGGAGSNFLRDNARRIGRQMLTAGGADQLVSDGGPNGHSVFTWTLLQALGGKADLNGDGLITATELAAYVAPAVSAVSRQTPAFGSLPGSEGGDFVFELPGETEFIGADTQQLAAESIALNSKLDASRTPPAPSDKPSPLKTPPPVVVKDLQGADQKLTPPAPVPLNQRQLAQRANDRGLQFYREKRYAEAEAEFTEALKLRPDFALAANNLGYVFYKQERYAEAARWYENAIRLDPSRAVAYLNLADARAKAGDKAAAQKAYRTYLELAPNGPGAQYARTELSK